MGVETMSMLTAAYVFQYAPQVGMWFMKMIGPGRTAQIKSGGSGYDLKGMMGSSKNDKAA